MQKMRVYSSALAIFVNAAFPSAEFKVEDKVED
jgi:hypothetical protein